MSLNKTDDRSKETNDNKILFMKLDTNDTNYMAIIIWQ